MEQFNCSDCCQIFLTEDISDYIICYNCQDKKSYYHDKVLEEFEDFRKVRSFVCCDKEQYSSNMTFYDKCSFCSKKSNKKHILMTTDTWDILHEAKKWWEDHDLELASTEIK